MKRTDRVKDEIKFILQKAAIAKRQGESLLAWPLADAYDEIVKDGGEFDRFFEDLKSALLRRGYPSRQATDMNQPGLVISLDGACPSGMRRNGKNRARRSCKPCKGLKG